MKALILTAHGVEDCELFYPYYRFKEEGFDVDVASPDGQKILGIDTHPGVVHGSVPFHRQVTGEFRSGIPRCSMELRAN